MIKSMTGFARTEKTAPWGSLQWEIRGVNHRHFECYVRLPELFRHLESAIREQLQQQLLRGKIDAILYYQPAAENIEITLNQTLKEQLKQALHELQWITSVHRSVDLSRLLQWPGLLQTQKEDLTAIEPAVMSTLSETLDILNHHRTTEGSALAQPILERADRLAQHVQALEKEAPKILASQRRKIEERLAELQQTIDPARLEQEMVYLAQKSDVMEELDRLKTHLTEIKRIIKNDSVAGRRLDFMMQELNREANTLASKSMDVIMTHEAVDMKVLIEQMREQIQNIL